MGRSGPRGGRRERAGGGDRRWRSVGLPTQAGIRLSGFEDSGTTIVESGNDMVGRVACKIVPELVAKS